MLHRISSELLSTIIIAGQGVTLASRKLTVKRWLPSAVVMTQPCLLELLRFMMRDNGVAGLLSGRSRGGLSGVKPEDGPVIAKE